MYIKKDYSNLLGLEGFSDLSLNTHFTLYEGYVKNVNSILEKLNSRKSEIGDIEKSELGRRLAWEYNGMKLHEIYFESLSKEKSEINKESKLALKLIEKYGSLQDFLNEFKRVGLSRGIGWVALAKEEGSEDLHILWLEEHATGIFANSKILLCMDLLEHAFIIDYNTNKAGYIEAFLKATNWQKVEERFEN